ncbi:MAG: chemotaxis protein CheX [Candidatus Aureabacteria bacterium]|nr:chemotaxis protein CheX [Candidatus Auribacterota bacterium]
MKVLEKADKITEAVKKVFEMTAFIEFEDSFIPDTDSYRNLPGIIVYVNYELQDKKGSVYLFWSQTLADEAAASYLGDEESSSENIVDALLELSNMVAGNILNVLIEKDEVYELEIPKILVKDSDHELQHPQYKIFFTEFDEKWIVVEIC